MTNGRFTLPAGVTSVYVRVATNTDGVYEGPESFRLTAGFVDPMLKFVDLNAATDWHYSPDEALLVADGLLEAADAAEAAGGSA